MEVFATVFFAMTVACVCVPLYKWLGTRGVPKWWASAATMTFAFAAAVAVFAPIFVIVYLRRGQLADLPLRRDERQHGLGTGRPPGIRLLRGADR
jgi:predicted PurR-regulated permease PerM